MKICVILSTYEGDGCIFQDFDPDYRDTKSHQFTRKFIKKETAREELDEICRSGDYEMYWSFIWGKEHNDVAGVEALKYLESLQVPLLGTNSKFLTLTKLDVKRLMSRVGIKTPKGTTNRELDLDGMAFPVIVKASNSLNPASVCSNKEEVLEQIRLLESKIKDDVVIEEFIVGSEGTVQVLETPTGVIALNPYLFKFPETWSDSQKFLDFKNEYAQIQNGTIGFDLMTSGPVEEVKRIAIKAYESLGVHGSGYARIDFRITDSGDMYLLGVNPCPAFFNKVGILSGDAFAITKFPGGHEAYIDTIIASKQRINKIVRLYDDWSEGYDTTAWDQNFVQVMRSLVSDFEFEGRVLDLGCGTGIWGRIILSKFPQACLIGIDASAAMVKPAKEFYSKIHIGFLEDVMLELSERFDHMICAGTLLLIDPKNFIKILDRMFELSNTSITIMIEDVDKPSKDALVECGHMHFITFNHLATMDKYNIPKGWTQVLSRKEFLWTSLRTGVEMYGIIYRFEKGNNPEFNGTNGFSNGGIIETEISS